MTLATVPEYDAGQVSRQSGRAIVVGGSVAGLLAARVLAEGVEEVVVLDRDPLPRIRRRGGASRRATRSTCSTRRAGRRWTTCSRGTGRNSSPPAG